MIYERACIGGISGGKSEMASVFWFISCKMQFIPQWRFIIFLLLGRENAVEVESCEAKTNFSPAKWKTALNSFYGPGP